MNEVGAIQTFRAAGLHAEIRSLSLGHTIFVGQGSFTHGGLTGWRCARWIYQKGDAWLLNDGVKEVYSFPSLADAVDHTVIALKHDGHFSANVRFRNPKQTYRSYR